MTSPLLTIITVNLNNREGLQRTIDSVVEQTFTDYEWIVIDGGSTDGSRELIEQYADHFTYWVSEPDKGIYNAMNKGIAHAKGDWLQFLNSGDWLYEETTLEKVFSKDYDADVVYGDVAYIDPISLTVIQIEEKPPKVILHFLYEHTLCHQSTFYRNIVFNQYKYNEKHRIVSDWDLYLILLANNYRFLHIPLVVVYFSLNGLTDNNSSLNLTERKTVLKDYIPPVYKKDYDRLIQFKRKEALCQQHKSIRFLNIIHEKIISFIIKAIDAIESIRLNHNKKRQ